MAGKSRRLTPGRQQLLVLLLAAIILYIALPQFGSFQHSLTLAKGAEPGLLAISLLFTAMSYVAAAGNYRLLAVHRLSYPRTLLIQLAGMFVNRLLPAGIGSISVNFLNLRQSGHSGSEAASVVAANNGLGIAGNLILLIALWLPFHDELPGLHIGHISKTVMIVVVVIVAALVLWLASYARYRERFQRNARLFWRQLMMYRHRPGHLSAALVCSIGLTMSNVLSLWFCVLAMNISLPFIAVLITFSCGVALGAATPTPGGLGGVEAGLVAGLVAYHVDSAAALAAVLVYRLISYWLPLAAGAAALLISQRRGYLTVN
ncbi:MAG TPA: lysylphosphatidylglycerol synthase transmembrane domain-containing protein [Candidatus Saccharimonadales bacterium]|nr:lysylphosphatidylglycerol synthase transmembrane domain-containing protein [Candidatus Saccharimonadales bacterium]